MSGKAVRVVLIVLTVIILVIVGFIVGVKNYFGYLVLSALITQGVKAIVDYLYGFPMRVGVSKILENNSKNGVDRVLLLFLGVALALFSCWWIATKPI